MLQNLLKAIVCLVWLLSSCQTAAHKKHPSLFVFSGTIMTINYRILVGHPLSKKEQELVEETIDKTFAEIDAIYNKWNPLSEISRLNTLSAHEPAPLSPQLFQFLRRIDELVTLTDGLFDPTVEPLQQLWLSHLQQGSVPSQEELNSIKACIGWDKIHFEQGVFYKDHSLCQLDLGGIAKGYCVDLLVERLEHKGFSNLLVEWGGEIRASGQHPDKRPWNIFISRLGDPNPQTALAYIPLQNQAIATSGDYFQWWVATLPHGEQAIYCHIFNPKTLAPLLVQPGSIASASLIADDCTTADALAKVLMLFESAAEAQLWMEKIGQKTSHLSYWIAIR